MLTRSKTRSAKSGAPGRRRRTRDRGQLQPEPARHGIACPAVGKVESRKVLDADAGLFEARTPWWKPRSTERPGWNWNWPGFPVAGPEPRPAESARRQMNAIFDRAGITRQQYREPLKDIQSGISACPAPEDTTIERARRVLRSSIEPAQTDASWPGRNRPPCNSCVGRWKNSTNGPPREGRPPAR
jgi:hypothetical protein